MAIESKVALNYTNCSMTWRRTCCDLRGWRLSSFNMLRKSNTMLALAGAGIGVGLVPEGTRKLMFDGVASHPMKITPKTYSELTFVWRRRTDNPALKVFTQFLLPKFLDQSIG